MTEAISNVALIEDLIAARNAGDLERMAGLSSPDLLWHYRFGAPALRGDYPGLLDGAARFQHLVFNLMGDGTARLKPRSITAVGATLVLCHVRIDFTIEGRDHGVEAALLFRVEDGLVAEAWDFPDAVDEAIAEAAGAAVRALEEHSPPG